MSYSALAASFEYLCYESKAIIFYLIIQVRGSTKDNPRAERVNDHNTDNVYL